MKYSDNVMVFLYLSKRIHLLYLNVNNAHIHVVPTTAPEHPMLCAAGMMNVSSKD